MKTEGALGTALRRILDKCHFGAFKSGKLEFQYLFPVLPFKSTLE